MYKIPANTLFLGKNLVFVPECHSTNTLAFELISKSTSVLEGTTIITNNQTAGRGQRGNTWESAQGVNLTFSVILKPTFLSIQKQFFLTIATSLAVRNLVERYSDKPGFIKWPNDIIVENKKISGILIENQVQGSSIGFTVIGIGLNVNELNMPTSRATSLNLLTQKTFQLSAVLEDLLETLEKYYLKLRSSQQDELQQEYLTQLYRKDQATKFVSDGNEWNGTIKGIDPSGRLIVINDQEEKTFDLKEISMVMD